MKLERSNITALSLAAALSVVSSGAYATHINELRNESHEKTVAAAAPAPEPPEPPDFEFTLSNFIEKMTAEGWKLTKEQAQLVDISGDSSEGYWIEFRLPGHDAFEGLFLPGIVVVFKTKGDGDEVEYMLNIDPILRGSCLPPDIEALCVKGPITGGLGISDVEALKGLKQGELLTAVFATRAEKDTKPESKPDEPALDIPPLVKKAPRVGDIIVVQYGGDKPQIGYKRVISSTDGRFALTRINSTESDGQLYSPDLSVSVIGFMDPKNFREAIGGVEAFRILGVLAPEKVETVESQFFKKP